MIRVISDTKTPIRIWASDLEKEAEQQLRNLSTLPFLAGPVAVMPDAHAGKGSTVGTVIATKGAIIPAAVGVDIGCGMCAVKLPYKIEAFGGDKRLAELRHSIERAIPLGMNRNKDLTSRTKPVWEALVGAASPTAIALNREFNQAALSIGTLGGGNHFIEICKDSSNDAWIVLHSGSRNIGKRLADVHINSAKGLMKSYFIELPDPDLAYLAQGTPQFDAYIKDLMWAQDYAQQNRNEMMERVLEQVYRHISKDDWHHLLTSHKAASTLQRIDCHHNYTSIENYGGKNMYVTRKGAVSAKAGELGIIPGSMGAKSFIVRGLGNEASYCSCSHGAGRKMSRTKAKELFTVADLEAQTSGVECRKDGGVVDEIPGAYKSIDEVMANQSDLVETVYELKQVICVKG